MRPSISVTLDPGLDQGLPRGRDLYTFVTSAAGHMMRTLQKPRKNRPPKRQVNHRRFLHNMIQRKFADIEAANHRLASALYYTDKEKTSSPQRSQKPAADSPSHGGHQQDPDKYSVHDQTEVTDLCTDSRQSEVRERNGSRSPHPWTVPLRFQPNISTGQKVDQDENRERKRESRVHDQVELTSVDFDHRIFHTEYYASESPVMTINSLLEDTSLQKPDLTQCGQNISTSPLSSPELSPLSLDSCDFSVQMFADVSSCSQAQSITDIAGSPWADIMDLFSIERDLGGGLDPSGGDVEWEVREGGHSVDFTQRTRSNTSEIEEAHFGYECGRLQDLEMTVPEAAETRVNDFGPCQCSDMSQQRLPTSSGCHHNAAYQRTGQHRLSDCLQENCGNDTLFTPFQGVAQSFSAPLADPELRPIKTPPHDSDWMFPDILKERKSPDS